jgi:hypothetical protein
VVNKNFLHINTTEFSMGGEEIFFLLGNIVLEKENLLSRQSFFFLVLFAKPYERFPFFIINPRNF